MGTTSMLFNLDNRQPAGTYGVVHNGKRSVAPQGRPGVRNGYRVREDEDCL